MKYAKRICKILLIAAFWIAVWGFAAWKMGKPLLFPSPLVVFRTLAELVQTPQFYTITLRSLGNVLFGILLAVLGGTVLAAITSRVSLLRELFLPIMTVIKATPVASFIVLAMIWIGSEKVPSLITLLIVLPVVWTNLDEGVRKIDPQLREVARSYHFSIGKQFRFLILPSLTPFFSSAMRTSLGLAWKAGIAAEIIAMPRNTIGTMIGEGKLYIETDKMFAWTLTVILLSLLIEFAFTALFKHFEQAPQRNEDAA